MSGSWSLALVLEAGCAPLTGRGQWHDCAEEQDEPRPAQSLQKPGQTLPAPCPTRPRLAHWFCVTDTRQRQLPSPPAPESRGSVQLCLLIACRN